jgi:hypothetical protein
MSSEPDTRAFVAEAPPLEGRPSPAPRRRFREFLVNCRDDEGGYRPKGFGLTLDEVLAEVVEDLDPARAADVQSGRMTADQWLDQTNDLTVWEGDRLAAVIRPLPGRGVEVTRFDGIDDGPAPPRPAPQAEPEPEAEPDPTTADDAPPFGVRVARGPLPMCRGALTFNNPTEPGTLVTLEVIVTDDNHETMPTWYGMPEYRAAGWEAMTCGPFTVATRVIGC